MGNHHSTLHCMRDATFPFRDFNYFFVDVIDDLSAQRSPFNSFFLFHRSFREKENVGLLNPRNTIRSLVPSRRLSGYLVVRVLRPLPGRLSCRNGEDSGLRMRRISMENRVESSRGSTMMGNSWCLTKSLPPKLSIGSRARMETTLTSSSPTRLNAVRVVSLHHLSSHQRCSRSPVEN